MTTLYERLPQFRCAAPLQRELMRQVPPEEEAELPNRKVVIFGNGSA